MQLAYPIKNRPNLTMAASALMIVLKDMEIATDEAAHYHAPSECYASIYYRARHTAHKLANGFGFKTVELLLDAMAAATSHKYMYHNTELSQLIIEEQDKFANL